MAKNSGQAMIEILVIAPVAALIIGFGGYLVYLAFAKAWLTRSAREAAVCLVGDTPSFRCRSRLRNTLDVGLPFGRTEIENFRSGARGSDVKVSLNFASTPTSPDVRSDARLPRRITAAVSIPKNLAR